MVSRCEKLTAEVRLLASSKKTRLIFNFPDTTFYYGLLNGKDEQPDYADVRALYTGLS